ncbi:uncharacterized protein [Pyrus communis]|uniref:uncharacterized protein isoform X3 n=1 Tax=Pyrus communis TaxID=23211 RepID=UPI0035BFCFEA
MDGKFVMELPLWLLLCMMEERMPSSNAFSPEMLFPPDVFSPGEGMLNCQKSFHQRKKIIGNRNYLMNLPRSCNILSTFREFEKQLCKWMMRSGLLKMPH